MTKKQISMLLLIVMCLALVLSCAACWDKTPTIPDSDSNNNSNNNNNTETPKPTDKFEDYGMNVITVVLDEINVNKDGVYDTKEEVGAYIYLYHKLPSNYVTNKGEASRNHTAENKKSYGGVVFYNREGLLPTKTERTYTECDIGYKGGNRNSLRIVFSSDWLVFYTDDHYVSFSILRFV